LETLAGRCPLQRASRNGDIPCVNHDLPIIAKNIEHEHEFQGE
jgi:hypothetical protein